MAFILTWCLLWWPVPISKADARCGRGEHGVLSLHRDGVTAVYTFNELFKFSFSSPPCLRGWVWIIGSWRKRWETWLIRRSPWLTGRPKSLRSSSGECSVLMVWQQPLSMWWGWCWVFVFAHGTWKCWSETSHPSGILAEILIIYKSRKLCSSLRVKVSHQIELFKVQENHGHWVWLVAMEECWKESCAELSPPRGNKPGRSSGWVFVSRHYFLHLLGMWQNETNTVQLLCDLFYKESIWDYHKASQVMFVMVLLLNNDVIFLESSV